jgi:sucrose phosphorylase
MENNVNDKIKNLINLIYGKTFSERHLEMLSENISRGASRINERRKPGWDEKDIVLITYADQFFAKGEKALPVFTRFYNRWLARSFSHVHLLPFYPWSSDDGFSVIDYHQVAPGTVLITETNVPHKDNVSYFGDGQNEAQMVYQFSLPPLVLHAINRQDVRALCQWATTLNLPSVKTTWFNFLASHDGIGLNPLRGILPEPEILSLVEKLQQEGALVNWKNNPDGTRSPYEINVTYLDALSSKDAAEDERIARFILAHAVLLTFPGVPAIYIQSILGSENDYEGVKRLGYNRAINRKKYPAGQIDAELENKRSLRHKIYHQLSDLIALRRTENAFHPDSQALFERSGEHILKITRVADKGERITALFNFSDRIQSVYSENLSGTDLISHQDIRGTDLSLNPWQVMWIKEH